MATITTKFEFGARVFTIVSTGVERQPVVCHACEGTKTVMLRGDTFECPACKGKGEIKAYARGWVVSASGKIGQVRVEHTIGEPIEIKYMLDSTGIGSGTLHDEERCFPSRDDAQAECDRRNGFPNAREAY